MGTLAILYCWFVRGNPGNRGKRETIFKTNRNGYFGPFIKYETINYDPVVINQLLTARTKFFDEHDLLSEIIHGQGFVKARYNQTVDAIRDARLEDFGPLKKILRNITDEKVITAYKDYSRRTTQTAKSQAVEQIRDIAMNLEHIDVNMAEKIMTLASLLRPNGKVIQKKLDEYRKKLKLNDRVCCGNMIITELTG